MSLVERRPPILLSEVPAQLVHELHDPRHLVVVELVGLIPRSVVVGMETGVDEERGHAGHKKRPMVTSTEEVGLAVVVSEAQV